MTELMEQAKKQFRLWPKQMMAFESPATEILYGGAAGPGKSHLLRVVFMAWAMEIPGLQLYLFRRHYRDLIQGHMEGPTGFRSMLAEAVSLGRVQIVELEIRFKNGPTGGFDGGSRISLNHCQHERDVEKYKTIEFHALGVEEATEFTEFMIRYLRSRIRMPNEMKGRIPDYLQGRFPRALYVTNPGGPGHDYFKRMFVDAAEPGIIWRASDEDGGLLRQFIKARLTDNPSVDPVEYAKRLQGIGSEAYVNALLNGDWSAPLGGFYPEFSRAAHVVPNFRPPAHWFRFRSFDWGSSAPFAVYWWAVSDGCEVKETGRTFPRGALIAYREWYGCNEKEPAKGLELRNEDVADGIMLRSPGEEEKKLITVTDSLPFQDRGGLKISDVFLKHDVPLIQGDTSRIPGWSQLRSRLKGDERGPQIYFAESCRHAIRTLQALLHDPLNPEEVIDQDDHAPDAIRLACTSRSRIKDTPAPTPSTENIRNDITFNDALKKIKKQKQRANAGAYY